MSRKETPTTAGHRAGPEGGSESQVSSPSEDCKFVNAAHPEAVLGGLNDLRKKGHFCDVTLCVDGQTFPVHRSVLASFSPYFRAMFLSSLAESQSEHVTLSGVDANMVSLLLDYAYTSAITITESNVQALLSASNLLEVSAVREACCRFLERHIDVSNCVGIHCFAEAHACHELTKKAKAYTLRNFTNVVVGEEWLNLPVEKVVEIISADELEVEREEHVFGAATAWLHHSYQARAPTFHKILENVRLALVSPYFLVDVVEGEMAVRSSPECRVIVEEARLYHLLPDRRHQLTSPRTRHRRNTNTTTVIVAVGGEDNKLVLRSVECYDPHAHCWRSLSCLPFAVSKHGLVVSGENVMYLAGGEFPDGTVTRCMWRYDPVLDEWHDLAPMSMPRSELGAASLDGYIYAVGGWDGSSRLDSVERYDPRTNSWKEVAPMKLSLTSPAVAACQGKLYVCGGAILEDGDGIDMAQVYDPHTDTWEQLPSMIIPRSGSAAAVLHGLIYIIGGWHASTENTNKVERFDPRTSTWQTVAGMCERRYRPGVAVVDSKIYILGGEDGWEHFHDTIESYSPTEDKWTPIGEMLTGRSWLSCAPLRIKKEILGDLATPLS
ncbi:kelch-like protein diablo [Penaeus vannamei]|uniref:Kelch-like protein diablo n=1 Tax=Penaeus vannamei TaxID=6689 RepID=A0A3R7MC30_PENVA|nr:kelch-like protein diablo [Penaeus vannamei]ROT77865.1 putative kelch-like protein diablo-like [Penaeus vannamei]